MRARSRLSADGLGLLLALALALPALAGASAPQSAVSTRGQLSPAGESALDARLWATVILRDGSALEGFLIWDLNEATRDDVLQTDHRLPPEMMELWTRYAPEDGGPWDRSVDLNGVRLTWEEEDPAYPAVQRSGLRFGHIARIRLEENEARVELRSGQVLQLVGTTTDLGPSVRSIRVESQNAAEVTLAWEDIQEVRMGVRPPSAFPSDLRLHGTLLTRSGGRFTGWVTWDAEEAFASDSLDGDNRSLVFSEIAVIERHPAGALVTLLNGETVQLAGTNDVNDDNRGIQIADPALGSAQVEWAEFAELRLHAPGDDVQRGGRRFGSVYDDGAPLRGTVWTESGELHSGAILWDMKEGGTWDFLEGVSEGVQLQVEFSEVARIEKISPEGASVTLRDGRVLTLIGEPRRSGLGEWNRGILVTPESGDRVFLDWAGFRSVDFAAAGDAP